MPTTRRRRTRTKATSELIEAILSGEKPLRYTPERHSALIGWAYLNEPPAGCERLKRPFNIHRQLDAWRKQHEQFEREWRANGRE
jgi:hypothetical protein